MRIRAAVADKSGRFATVAHLLRLGPQHEGTIASVAQPALFVPETLTGEAVKPFVFQRREPLTRMMKGIDDLETKDVKFMTEARYNVGYFAWWTSILCTLTT